MILNSNNSNTTKTEKTHNIRVANRTNLAPGKNVVVVEETLNKVVPEQYKLHAHHWLILHGRYTCVARKPRCPRCIIRDLCEYKFKTTQADFANEK